jgi:hypothetical protein
LFWRTKARSGCRALHARAGDGFSPITRAPTPTPANKTPAFMSRTAKFASASSVEMHAWQLAAQNSHSSIHREKIDLKKCQPRSCPCTGILWKWQFASRVLHGDFHEPG